MAIFALKLVLVSSGSVTVAEHSQKISTRRYRCQKTCKTWRLVDSFMRCAWIVQ